MDGITDMVFVLKVVNNDEFHFEFINNAAIQRLGLSIDIIGLSIKEVERVEKVEFLYEQYRKVIRSQTGFSFEDTYDYIGETPKKYYFETILTPLSNKQGLVDHIVAVVRDITKEKVALSSVREMASNIAESNERFHSLFFHNTDGIFIQNKMGYITDGNEASEKITGYKVEELVGKSFNELVETKDIDKLNGIIDEAINGTNKSCNIVIKNKNGDFVNILYKIVPLFVDGVTIGMYGILRDVTDLMKNIEKLEESEKRFRIIAENANDLITLVNKHGEIIYVSPSYKNILGYQNKEFLGKNFIHNVCSTDQERLVEIVKKSIQSGEAFTIEFKQKNAKEEMLWCESIGKPVFNPKGELQHLVVLTRDITLRKEYESKLKYFAYHDALTELPNRILFDKRFASAKKQFLNKNNGLAIVILDIDHFKVINDTYGHDIGDAVIKEFGGRIQQSIRNYDTVARLGGDEFVILLPNIYNNENAIEIAKRIKFNMQQPWNINGQKLKVTTSMGIAMVTFPQKFTKSELIKKADTALYEAKNSGRDCYKLYID